MSQLVLPIPLLVTVSAKAKSGKAHWAVQTYRVLREILRTRRGGLTDKLGAWSVELGVPHAPPNGQDRPWQEQELTALGIIRATDEDPHWQLLATVCNAVFHGGAGVRTDYTVVQRLSAAVPGEGD